MFDSRKIKTNHVATIGVDQFTLIRTIEEEECVVKLWDTAGQEKFRSVVINFFRNADSIIIMFDLTQKDTFKSVT